jgi:NADH-quinone oxidoreductase subunit G
MGFQPVRGLKEAMKAAKALYVVAADPAGDDPDLAETGDFLVVQELFLTDTARLADVVLPAQAFTEREGTYTSGERRVQRFYPAVPERAGSRADFAIAGQIGQSLGLEMESRIASKVMVRIAAAVKDYAGISYTQLAQVTEQWPIVGRGDVYYGGTTYENRQGLGVQIAPAVERGQTISLGWQQPPEVSAPEGSLLAVPITRLYDRGRTVKPSKLLHLRIPQLYIVMNPEDATRFRIAEKDTVQMTLSGSTNLAVAHLDETLPAGFVLVPRSLGAPISGPAPVELRSTERVRA